MTMYWLVVFQFLCLLLHALGMSIMNDPLFAPTEMKCVKYSDKMFTKIMSEGMRSKTSLFGRGLTKRSIPDVPAQFALSRPQSMSRRMNNMNIIDNLIPRDYLVKEHAKLVHDINSLRHVILINPLVEDGNDYDDSIFHEMIEPVTAPPRTLPRRPSSFSEISPFSFYPKETSFPVFLAGGSSQRQVIRSQPINFAKPTINLIGTTISPVVKHPYPFVRPQKPVKICVTSLPPIATPRPRQTAKTIWERLIDYFLPRRNLNR